MAAQENTLVLLLNRQQWTFTGLSTLAAGAVSAWVTIDISVWIGITVALAWLTACHMIFASRSVVALPHIAILIAALQYVFGAWLGYHYRPADLTYDIADRLPTYLAYAGPLLIAMAIGWGLTLARLPASVVQPRQVASPALLTELDLLIALGVAASILDKILRIESLAFAVLLVGNLRFVGVFGRMLAKGPGWQWRLALVLGAEALFAVGSSMFHDLLLWTAWTFVIWAFAFKPPPRFVAFAIIAGIIFLPALQEAKWRLRANPLEDDPLVGESISASTGAPLTRAVAWVSYLVPSVARTLTLDLEPQFLSDIAMRYNQGWIVNRVMMYVPDVEPYAGGATIKDAITAALLPRVLAPTKVVAGGHEHMARYAAIELNESTSMTLGFAGEMYANFGSVGGIIGCGVYALAFGLVFRAFGRRAFANPLWWSVVPFVFYSALKAEDDIAFVLNWTAKSMLVAGAVILFLPTFRRMLLAKPPGQRVHRLPGTTSQQSALASESVAVP